MKCLTIAFLLPCLGFHVSATEQMPDVYVEDNKVGEVETHWGYLSPLEHYFHRRKIESPFTVVSSANYRGHVAHWAIIDNKLFLTEVLVEGDEKTTGTDQYGNVVEIDDPFDLKPYDLHALFEEGVTENGRFADWFSDSLLLKLGAYKKSLCKREYTILYKECKTITVEEGVVTESHSFTYDEYRSAMDELNSWQVQKRKLSVNGRLLKAHYDAQISPPN